MKSLFVLFILLFACNSNADEPKPFTKYLEVVDNLLIDVKDPDISTPYIFYNYKFFNETFYQIHLDKENSDENSAIAYLYKHIKIKEKYELKLNYPSPMIGIEYDKAGIADYSIEDDNLLVLIGVGKYYLYWFKQVGKEFVFKKRFEFDLGLRKCIFNKNKIIVSNFMLAGSNLHKPSQVYLYMYDIETKADSLHFFENPSGIDYANQFRNSFIDYHSGQIAITEVDKYVIRMYNDNFELVQVLHREIPGWIHSTLEDSKLKDLSIQESILNAAEEQKKVGLLPILYFLDENTLLVNYRLNLKDSCPIQDRKNLNNFDIWKKNGDKWTLYKKDLYSYPFKDEEMYSFKNNFIMQNFVVYPPYILSAENFPFEYSEDFEKMTAGEVNKMRDEHYIENPIGLTLLIRKLNLE